MTSRLTIKLQQSRSCATGIMTNKQITVIEIQEVETLL